MVDFGEQYGPLPLGGWIAVVAGGLGIAIYSRRTSTAPASTEIGNDTSAVPGVGEGFSAYIPAVNAGSTTQPQPEITDNESWGRAAIRLLIAKGFDPNMSDQAIRKYLGALTLTPTEYAAVGIALIALGSPPVPLPAPEVPVTAPTPVVTTPLPTTTPTPAPVKTAPPKAALRYYTVVKGDSLWKIAQRFYGAGYKWGVIHQANIKGSIRPDGTPGFISNPNYLRPGDRLYIP